MTFDWEIPLLVGGWASGILAGIVLIMALFLTVLYVDEDMEAGDFKIPALLWCAAIGLAIACVICAGFYSGTYSSEQPQQTTTEQHNGPN
ncbi:membrane protein [Gordonia phage Guey18]|nr:membrane protein [Gordonia phage Guey18]